MIVVRVPEFAFSIIAGNPPLFRIIYWLGAGFLGDEIDETARVGKEPLLLVWTIVSRSALVDYRIEPRAY